MGTAVSVTIYARTEPDGWRVHVDSVFGEIEKIEKLTTVYDASEVSRLGLLAGKSLIKTKPEVLELLRMATEISKRANGAFDVTILPLYNLWHFGTDSAQVPNPGQIAATAPLVDFTKIIIEGEKAGLSETGMAVDLGGIAKGYSVDKAVDLLQRLGYSDFMVEAGGDLRAVASSLTKGERKVWIRHPRHSDKFLGWVAMDEGAVATSGDYERFFEQDGVRYHHILDPGTGYPARPAVSATVFAANTAVADAYSTAIFVLGPEQGIKLLEENANVEGLVVYEDKATHTLQWTVSSGLRGRLTINDSFN